MLKNILKKRMLIIYVIIVIIVILFNLCYIYLSNSLKLNGKDNVKINYGEKYEDAGANFKVFKTNLTDKINVKTNINNKKIGRYKVTYSVKYLIFTIKKERVVEVVDKKKPIITLEGLNEVNICPDSIYSEEGYKAIDEYDGDITDKVKRTFDEDGNIIYEVTDSSGNKTTTKRKLKIGDKDAPQIKLKGNSTVYVKLGSNYVDDGYDVIDNCDIKLNVDVNNTVNTNVSGKYKITYTVTDSSSNTSTLSRNVIVYDNDKTGTVYLTFDDGPSGTGSTEKILNILKNEGVKATFFVTSNGPDYLIKREYEEGHTVALHTSTHNYSYIYSSIDNYFEDLLTVQNRIYRLTGQTPKILRFPGGSNNTVSNRYNPGIMNTLTKMVVDKGYTYFDWNVSSGDAGNCTTSDCVYNNVVNNLSKNRVNVVLMHDIKMFTADALKEIIDYCKLNGYTFKVIDENTYPVIFK